MDKIVADFERKPIGAKGLQVDYTRDERAFHSCDVPAVARQKKLEVLQSRHDQAPKWQSTTYIDPVWQRTRRQTQLRVHDPAHYQYNYRAEVNRTPWPIDIDVFGRSTRVRADTHFHRTAEMPVHPNLEGKHFSTSTEVSQESISAQFEREEERRERMTTKQNERILSMSGRKSLVTRYEDDLSTLRQTRSAAAEVRDKYVGASKLLQYELSHKGGFGETAASAKPSVPPAPDETWHSEWLKSRSRSAATTRRTQRLQSTCAHPGSYCVLPGERRKRRIVSECAEQGQGAGGNAPEGEWVEEPAYAWSCCGAEDRDARGCLVRTRDLDRHMYDSFCH